MARAPQGSLAGHQDTGCGFEPRIAITHCSGVGVHGGHTDTGVRRLPSGGTAGEPGALIFSSEKLLRPVARGPSRSGGPSPHAALSLILLLLPPPH